MARERETKINLQGKDGEVGERLVTKSKYAGKNVH